MGSAPVAVDLYKITAVTSEEFLAATDATDNTIKPSTCTPSPLQASVAGAG